MKKNLLIALLLSSFGLNANEAKINEINLELDKTDKVLNLNKNSTKDILENKEITVDVKTSKTDITPTITDPLAPNQNDNKSLDLIKKMVEDKSKTEILPNNTPEKITDVQPKNKPTNNITKTETNLKPLKKITTTTVVKELNLVTPTKNNWWKWLGLLALLGALLGFLAATLKKRKDENEAQDLSKKNRHSDREVQFTFEEEKEDKGLDKRHYNKDHKNRD